MKILVIEDNEDFSLLLTDIIKIAIPTAAICYAETVEEALPQISNSDLVISDFYYQSSNFLELLPRLQKENKRFILQSACPKRVKIYDSKLQLDAINKGFEFTTRMLTLLTTLNLRFNNS